MSAAPVGKPSPTTWPGSVENEQVTFRRYSHLKSLSAGVDTMENARTTIPGQDHVLGEACQTENPFILHSRRDQED
jgi:hypothetical protein